MTNDTSVTWNTKVFQNYELSFRTGTDNSNWIEYRFAAEFMFPFMEMFTLLYELDLYPIWAPF
jgi:hypothetical protein